MPSETARPPGSLRRRRAGLGSALALCVGLSACHAPTQPPAEVQATPDPAAAAQPMFEKPPRILSVTAGPGGAAEVAGVASPDSRVRAVTTDEASYGATAGHDGRFVLELPPLGRTRLVSLSMQGRDRSNQATGWLFLPPDAPERSVLLEAGDAAGPLAGGGLVTAFDYDPGGGAAVSGRAKPGETVGLALDSGEPQSIRAGADGVWSWRFPDPLTQGSHVLHLRTRTTALDRTVVLAPRPFKGVFEAVREADDWRIDWRPRGDGAQTTLVFLDRAS